MLGNDLVDLADPETEEAALHPRFDARAFTAAERAALAAAADRHELRWRLWAAKEAAYKAARRRDGAVRFHPREFVVEGDVVAHASGRYHVAWSRAEGALHAVASPEGEGVGAVSPSVKKGSDPFLTRFVAGARRLAADEDPGASAREQAIRSAAEILGCASSELSVSSAARVPQLLRGGAPTGLALSLSHHGAYAGFALAVDEGRP